MECSFTFYLPENSEWIVALIEPVAVACHDVRLSRLKDEDVLVIGGGPIEFWSLWLLEIPR